MPNGLNDAGRRHHFVIEKPFDTPAGEEKLDLIPGRGSFSPAESRLATTPENSAAEVDSAADETGRSCFALAIILRCTFQEPESLS